MSTISIPECLDSLVDFLNSLERRATLEELRQHLVAINVSADDLKPFAHYGDSCYRRNLICESTWFELLCICWKSGQRSPIHDHANSSCGVRVVQGVVTETGFEKSPCGLLKATRSCDLKQGEVCCSQDDQVHQISNLQADGELMTLHIYSPPLTSMKTYSLTEDSCGSFDVR